MIISLIFCFLNSEVKSEIRKLIERKILEYDPENRRRFSRFISNRDKLNSIPSITTQDRLQKISSKEMSTKNFFNGSIQTKDKIKSRESSVFFPKQNRKSNYSSAPTLMSDINNLSANRLSLIDNSADNNSKNKNSIIKKTNSNFLNSFFKRNSNESDPYEEDRFKIKFKKKSTQLTKVDSFKIIKNYMHKEKRQPDEENKINLENDLQNEIITNVNEIVNLDRCSENLDSLDIIDTNFNLSAKRRQNVDL